MVKML